MDNLTEQLEGLSPDERASFVGLLLDRQPNGKGIPKRPAGSSAPLSFAQQRLWFLERMHPDTAHYNISNALRLSFVVNVDALRRALNFLVERHEILRCAIVLDGAGPVQRPIDGVRVLLDVVDLRKRPSAHEEAARLCELDAGTPFDLGRAPLLRAKLMQLTSTDSVLLLTLHHLVSDGWSMSVLFRELSAAYQAFIKGQAPRLPDLAIQYPDFAAWQRANQTTLQHEQLEHWRRQLAGAPPCGLPTDFPRPPLQSFRGAYEQVVIAATTVNRVRELANACGTTHFVVLLAIFKLAVARFAGVHDIVVGSPFAGRTKAETEPLVGFFVNSLVLRTQLSTVSSFRELIGRVHETVLEAAAHQDVPFESVVEHLRPSRDLSRNPLFQVLFQLQNTPSGPSSVAATPFLSNIRHVSKFDLSMEFFENEGALSGGIEYATELFLGATIARFVVSYLRLLDAALFAPDSEIWKASVMSDEERRRALDSSRGERRARSAKSLQALVSKWVELQPNAIAIEQEGERLTYRVLDERARALAHVLGVAGVQQGDIVAICLDRSLEHFVACLGVLCAGAAFLVLDPTHPSGRLETILGEARPRVTIVSAATASQIPLPFGRLTWEELGVETALNVEARPDCGSEADLAYVLYTSGTSGKPKGVLIEQRGLVNVAEVQRRAFGTQPGNRILQFSALTFDASVFDMAMAWGSGATLVVAPKQAITPGPSLAHVLHTQAITHLTIPPSALSVVPAEPLPNLRVICAAGEPCGRELVDRWAGGRRFFNLYGPTEGTIWSTIWEASPEQPVPTLGHPIDNVEVYVLDARLAPVPRGVPGEIYLGGVGVARGYLGDPDQTAKRFVPHPFADQGHCYRTGDRGRVLENGEIAFLGRDDDQIKSRGFRIELCEIDSVLARHPAVKAAATALRGGSRDPGVIAFYVRRGEVTQAGLRRYLAEHLPDYMLPSALVELESLPLTRHGKVDRAALSALETEQRDSDPTPPCSRIERDLLAVWQELLGREQIGTSDNFFDSGGHSLLVARLQAMIESRLHEQVTILELFRHPSIRSLAALLVERARSQGITTSGATASNATVQSAIARARRQRLALGLDKGDR